MKKIKTVSHTIDDNGTMTIFVNDKSVADVSDCGNMTQVEIETVMTEILSDLGYEV